MTVKNPSLPAADLASIDLMLTQDERDVRTAVRDFEAADVQP